MKKIIFSCLFSLSSLLVIAQTGPAGIGNSTTIDAWLDASSISGLNNNDPVSSWADISGNNNDAVQATSINQPIYLTNQVNALPAINFDGTNDFLDFNTNITSGDITLFAVYLSRKVSQGSVLNTQKHFVLTKNNVASILYTTPNTRYDIGKPNNSFAVFSLQTDGAVSGSSLTLTSGVNRLNFTRNSLSNSSKSSIGNYLNIVYLQGQIAETIIYNQVLNSAERKIVGNHLAGKYNLAGEGNLYAFGSTNSFDILGIGQEADGNHTVADNGGEVVIANPSNLDNGEYLLIGHDNGSFASNSIDIPGGVVERVDRIWRADETGNVGTVTIDFDYTNTTFANPNNMVILFDDDGNFSNGGTFSIPATQVNVIPAVAEFDFVNVPDGAFFTFAEAFTDIASVQDGQWDQTTTWNCGCIPTDLLNVTIRHDVSIDSQSEVNDLVINAGASLTFTAADSLGIYGDFTIDGTFNPGSSRIGCLGTVFEQVFTNNTANRVDFHDFKVSNVDGVRLAVGEFGFTNKLQVVTGGLNVDGSNPNPAVIAADGQANTMCQILPSMDGAFSGDFIVERFISARPSNFANLSSPISTATVADLDDDLFLSGVGGANGNATTNTSGPFISVYSFNAATASHTPATITTPLSPGRGFEVYLATTLTNFNGGTIGFQGTPNDGDINAPNLEQGWNLMGNPYNCYINSNDVNRAGQLAGVFYVYNSSAGSYSSFAYGASPIPAGQGFWLDKTTTGSLAYTFQESYKRTNLTNANFLREKATPEVRLNVSQTGSPFNQDFVTRFNPQAIEGHDLFDGRYLPSPHKEVPALTRRIEASNTRLVMNVVDDYSFTHRIPLEFYAGVNGEYEIKTEDISSVYEKYNCVYLEDKEEGELIDLSVEQTYAFNSTEGKFDRFELILSNSYEECQKGNTDIQQEIDKTLSLRNALGNWYLDYAFSGDREERIQISLYNTAGQLIQNTQAYSVRGSGSLTLRFEELQGIYIIRIQSNNEFLNQTIHL